MTGPGTHLLDAVVRLLAAHGTDGVSVRAVAAEAGVSPAQVQYYFRTKDDLVRRAFEHVCDGYERRLREVAGNGLRALLLAWLPLDGEREAAARVWLALTARAVVVPGLRAVAERVNDDLRAALAGLLTGEPDPDAAAALLLAVVDGLTGQLLVGGPPVRDRVLAALATHLGTLHSGR